MEQQGVVLYGMMGSGKSELGVGVAKHFDWDFLDTDRLIEGAWGMTCKQLLDQGSFEYAQESSILRYGTVDPTVIATGGSVAMYPDLVSHLGQFGTGIFIQPTAAELRRRLSPERIAALNNPKNLSFEELYAERSERYRRAASFTLEITDRETPEQSLPRLITLVENLQ